MRGVGAPQPPNVLDADNGPPYNRPSPSLYEERRVALHRWLASCLVLAAALSVRLGAGAATAAETDAAESSAESAASGGPPGLLAAYFREPDAAKRRDIAGRFASIQPKTWDGFRALLHEVAPRDDLAPGVHRLQTSGTEPGASEPVQYVLRVPPGYEANASKGLPLVIACHGTGGSGDAFAREMESVLRETVDQVLLACPEAPKKGPYRVSRAMTDYPLRVLADVRRRANVDSDRVVLTGYSKGGYTTWGTVLFSPGEWAAAIPMASWPLTEARSAGAILYLPNVLNLPVQAHWGEKDIVAGQKEGINTLSCQVANEMRRLGAERFEGIEYPGQAHRIAVNTDAVRDRVSSARREPYPREFHLIFHRVWQGRAWWVRATEAATEEYDFTKPMKVPVTALMDVRQAQRQVYKRHAFELAARPHGDANTLLLSARNLRRVEVTIGPEMIDWSRPVKVIVNGRIRHSGPMEIDWWELIETARRTYDFERLVAARMELEVPVRR